METLSNGQQSRYFTSGFTWLDHTVIFFSILLYSRFSGFDEGNAQFCCENIAAHLEHTLEWEREMVIKRQQEVDQLATDYNILPHESLSCAMTSPISFLLARKTKTIGDVYTQADDSLPF